MRLFLQDASSREGILVVKSTASRIAVKVLKRTPPKGDALVHDGKRIMVVPGSCVVEIGAVAAAVDMATDLECGGSSTVDEELKTRRLAEEATALEKRKKELASSSSSSVVDLGKLRLDLVNKMYSFVQNKDFQAAFMIYKEIVTSRLL